MFLVKVGAAADAVDGPFAPVTVTFSVALVQQQ